MKNTKLAAVVVAVALALAGCGGNATSTAPATKSPTVADPGVSNEKPSITPIGGCVKRGDDTEFRMKATGFDQVRNYRISAWWVQADGSLKPYDGPLDSIGRFDKDGQPSSWSWICAKGKNDQPDPEGVLKIQIDQLDSKDPTKVTKAASNTITIDYQ